jgi:hypothetical protein
MWTGIALLIFLPLLIKLTGFNHGASILITLSNANHLPQAPALNTKVRLSFYPLNISQWGIKLNTQLIVGH